MSKDVKDQRVSLDPFRGSRYSGFIRPSKSTLGLQSLIGLDSPSVSLKGSFNNSIRFPKWMGPIAGPGPADYKVSDAETINSKNKSPVRVKIGEAERREPVIDLPRPIYGGVRELPQAPRVIFDRAPKESPRLEVAGRFAFHSNGDLFLRPQSPRIVFPTAKAQRGDADRCRTSPPLRNCHSPGIGRREVSFTTSQRDTFQFIPGKSEGAGRLYFSPQRERCHGGTISAAKRFRSTSPSITDRSPGPQTYRPSIAFSSSFRS